MPDEGIAVPESAEPATPGLPPDGSNPGDYPDSSGGDIPGDEPFLPDDSQGKDEGSGWWNDNESKGGGSNGGDGDGWGDWF